MVKGSSYATVGAVHSDDGGKAWHPLGEQPTWDIAISQAAPHRAAFALGEKGIAVQDALSTVGPTPTPAPSQDAPAIIYAEGQAVKPGDPDTLCALSSGLTPGLSDKRNWHFV